MPQVVIENPVLNSPFAEPKWHFRFGDEGITDEVVEPRRVSSYFIPIARPKKKGKQLVFDTEWTKDRIEENRLVNQIRRRVNHGQDARATLNLLIEVTGEKKKDKAAKVSTARNLWVPAINNHGGYGRWAFLEIADPWDAQNTIRLSLAERISQ